MEDKAAVIDVDGSYLYKKSKKLEESGLVTIPLKKPSAPLTGWEPLTEATAETLATKIHIQHQSKIYIILYSRFFSYRVVAYLFCKLISSA